MRVSNLSESDVTLPDFDRRDFTPEMRADPLSHLVRHLQD